MSSLDVITLGCRLNAYETEVMRQHATAAGLGDAVIVNTCAVTSEAVRQAERTIRKLRRERAGARIIVTGCAAQIEPERFAAMAGVDHVIGNGEKMRAETFLALATSASERVQVDDIMSVKETASHLLEGFGSRARAYVQVQNGCDHRCTFCIIPFGRGPSRSVPAGEVVAQVRRLVEAGYPEIVLTGVDITDYGKGLPGDMTLGRLVRQILRFVPELPRLRLSSIDSVEADHDLVTALAEEPRLMPHLHVSLQAGDDLILKRMKRRHSRAEAIAFCAEARRIRPDVAFGADLIAGFPTETDEMFARTLDLVEACDIAFVHAFPFSPRDGTPAARMPQVARPVVKARAERLREAGRLALACHLERQVGRTVEIVAESGKRGRAADFSTVSLDRAVEPGRLGLAAITAHDGQRLIGRLAETSGATT
ncbi:MAG TPA: tRNA (N(6)-L-threonylcarbamoyladenosine(37)-C(2))-methylthiotransferase MtaB [Hyphomicrobiaceae bacterium]|nr:tRNA (N(6)-L-threonylcarbamoyladenosine(37)-C(2))-methylthiotransferase MtaB [Hyphomicrobiaceae bacterium]